MIGPFQASRIGRRFALNEFQKLNSSSASVGFIQTLDELGDAGVGVERFRFEPHFGAQGPGDFSHLGGELGFLLFGFKLVAGT